MDIRGTVAGPLKVLIVDTTANKKGFEHGVTEKIYELLLAAGVAVQKPVFAATLPELTAATSSDFSAVLWVAHGGPPTDDRVARVVIGKDVYPWPVIGQSGIDFDTKLVALCVCSAGNSDMAVSLQRTDIFALATVASTVTLNGNEAVAFFPKFFAALKAAGGSEITLEQIEKAVTSKTGLAKNKMKFFGPE